MGFYKAAFQFLLRLCKLLPENHSEGEKFITRQAAAISNEAVMKWLTICCPKWLEKSLT